ncbi:hypothetical protein [Thermoflavimicrobium dichotomicum]|uniref:hypothetical protein n=1 Tax=Thermoflavimicrobium dichotomicum TaxID=46223 RepID=UPI001587EA14
MIQSLLEWAESLAMEVVFLGTFVYQNFGIQVSIAIMGISFIFSGLSLFLLPADPTPEERLRTSLREEMASGIRYFSNYFVILLYKFCGI